MSEYKWIAQDEDGGIPKFDRMPMMMPSYWGASNGAKEKEYGKPNPNWQNSLINLETHDYKIEDGILMKVEKQVILKGSELQYKDKSGKWNNCSYDEYRLKPKTVKFRNYITTQDLPGIVFDNHPRDIDPVNFKSWLGDWQEVEIDE